MPTSFFEGTFNQPFTGGRLGFTALALYQLMFPKSTSMVSASGMGTLENVTVCV